MLGGFVLEGFLYYTPDSYLILLYKFLLVLPRDVIHASETSQVSVALTILTVVPDTERERNIHFHIQHLVPVLMQAYQTSQHFIKQRRKIFPLLAKNRGRFLCSENIAIFYPPATQKEPFFSVSTSPNGTEITKLVLDNNTSNVNVYYLL